MIRVLVVDDHRVVRLGLQAVLDDAGAIGYQLKDADTETLLGGIRNAADGHAPLDPPVASEVLAS